MHVWNGWSVIFEAVWHSKAADGLEREDRPVVGIDCCIVTWREEMGRWGICVREESGDERVGVLVWVWVWVWTGGRAKGKEQKRRGGREEKRDLKVRPCKDTVIQTITEESRHDLLGRAADSVRLFCGADCFFTPP